MEAQEINLANFIHNDATFVIPVYQRNYDWKKSNCDRLFKDVENLVDTDKQHFLGTIVYQSIKKGFFSDYIIIDGQQRIASVIVLAKALYEVIDDSDIKKNINDFFIKHSNGNLKNPFRLKPSEYDSAVFEKLMSNEKINSDDFNETEKNSALYTNYNFFLQKINESRFTAVQIYNALSNLKVVRILLHNENAQEIFESLNSTGLDLSDADSIRNYLLMALEHDAQELLYKNYWLKIELLLKSSNAVENFFVQYLITKRKSDSITQDNKKARLSKKNLYEAFKKYFADNYKSNVKFEDVEKFLIDLYHYAEIYRRVTFDETTKFNELSPLDKKFYELTWLIDANNAPIILMYLYDRYDKNNFDETTFIKFVDALISLAFRAKVCSYNGVNAQFAGNVIARLDKYETLNEETFWQTLTFGKGNYAFPRDEEFINALKNSELYTNLEADGCKYLLYSLEKFIGGYLPDYSNTVVEHIIPKRLNKNWRNYLQAQNDLTAHELLVHTLGNLVLTADNEKVEWEDFDVKKNRFINSKFFYTKDVAKCANINSKQIQARAKKLAGVAVQIWTLPEKYNEQIKTFENIYYLDLDSDLEFFTGKKPTTISIMGTVKEVKTWKALAVEVMKKLYELDADTFRFAARADNVSKYFSASFGELREASKIDTDFYFETNRSTIDFLRFLIAFVENFNEMSGTNIKDEIWFTLRK